MDRIIAKTIDGLEDITISEVREILDENAEIICNGRVLFSTKNIKKFIEKTKSSELAYIFLKKFKLNQMDDIVNGIMDIDFSFINKDFVVRCSRSGEHQFSSIDVEKNVGEVIFNRGYNVNLNSKEIIYIDIIKNECIIGRLITKNLERRSYRVRINNSSITPILAYALLKISGYDKKESILDPFCKDGVILIEAALLGGKKLYGIDDANSIRNAKINAAMAKVKIDFYINGNEKLDLKEKRVDNIITNIPFVSRRKNLKQVKGILDLFFQNAVKIAKKNIGIVTKNGSLIDELYRKNGLKLASSRIIEIGHQKYLIMAFKP